MHQQKVKAQHTISQCRRIARAERTMKSAHPNSCVTYLELCSTHIRIP